MTSEFSSNSTWFLVVIFELQKTPLKSSSEGIHFLYFEFPKLDYK